MEQKVIIPVQLFNEVVDFIESLPFKVTNGVANAIIDAKKQGHIQVIELAPDPETNNTQKHETGKNAG